MTSEPQRKPQWGVFGGSFNPPHIGHVLAAHFALSVWALEKVIVVPSYQHPFGKPLVDFQHRVAMCQAAFAHLGGFVDVSRIEESLGGVSFTVDTLRAFSSEHPGVQFRLVIGGDILGEAEKWRAFDQVKELAPLLVIPRLHEGQPLGDSAGESCYLPDVSSTELREKLAAGEDTGNSLPAVVAGYIKQHRLYAG